GDAGCGTRRRARCRDAPHAVRAQETGGETRQLPREDGKGGFGAARAEYDAAGEKGDECPAGEERKESHIAGGRQDVGDRVRALRREGAETMARTRLEEHEADDTGGDAGSEPHEI